MNWMAYECLQGCKQIQHLKRRVLIYNRVHLPVMFRHFIAEATGVVGETLLRQRFESQASGKDL